MTAGTTREERASDAFLVLGSQYFVHARYSIQYFYRPVSVTLFHHAIEMLLKGFLAQTMTLEELKKEGHGLTRLWDLFKTKADAASLGRYDGAIARLDRVEKLRYPDSIVDEGYALHASLGPIPSPIDIPGTEALPKYDVNVSDLDAIATQIYAACAVSPVPYFNSAPEALKIALPPAFRPSGS